MTLNRDDVSVLWIEVGRKIPRYARRNIDLTSKMHPTLRQVLISEKTLKIEGVTCLESKKVPQSEFTKEFNLITKDWKFKQTYFWQGTTSRFFYLYDAMKELKLENVVHLETDCVLLEPNAFKDVRNEVHYKLAYPLQAEGIGCASILFIRTHQDLEEFLEFILSNWRRPDVDDMVLLGEFSTRRNVLILPTQIYGKESRSEFLFDAQSVGKYFLGTDARNGRLPFARRGLGDGRKGSMTNDLFRKDLQWRTTLDGRKLQVSVVGADRSFKYANIHIHSKFISRYINVMRWVFRISFTSKRKILWKIGLFDFAVLLERSASFSARRILRKKNFNEKNYR